MHNRHRNYSLHRRGFTLIELLVVVAILALLSTVVFGAVQDARDNAKDKALLSSAIQLRNALELYKADNNGLYPGEPLPIFRYQGARSTSGVFSTNIFPAGSVDLHTALSPYLKGNMVDPIYPGMRFTYYHQNTLRCFGQAGTARYILLIQPKDDLGLPGYTTGTGVTETTSSRCISAPD